MNSTETLKETLYEIRDQIRNAPKRNDQGAIYEEELFTEFVLNKMAEVNLFNFPETPDEEAGEFFTLAKYEGVYKGVNNRIDGVAMILDDKDANSLTAHIFIADYKECIEPEELTKDEFQEFFKQAAKFFGNSCKGYLHPKISPFHKAFSISKTLFEHREQICALKIWVLSTRYYNNPNTLRKTTADLDITARVIDLDFLANLNTDKSTVNIDFTNAGGLPYLAAGKQEQGYGCYFTAINAEYLINLYGSYGTGLVQANVRAYLGNNKTNKSMMVTIAEEPQNFLAFNNGLVVYAEQADLRDNRIYGLKGFQIINGGQTTATLYQTSLAAKMKKDPSEKERILNNLKEIYVPVKIISPQGEKADSLLFQSSISASANRQTAVVSSDLCANEPYHIEFEKICRRLNTSEGKWFYERARGSYKAEQSKRKGRENREIQKSFSYEFPKEKVIDRVELSVIALAWKGLPHECAKGKQLAFSKFNSECKGTFPTENSVKKLIVQWMIFKALEGRVKKEIPNPKVPVEYAISYFADTYQHRLDWDYFWNHQKVPEAFLECLARLTKAVNLEIRNNMGSRMISMYGRKPECYSQVKNGVDIKAFDFESCFVLK